MEKKQTQRRELVKTETENGVMQPQAKEDLEPPEAGRDKREFCPRAFRGKMVVPAH